MGFSLLLLGRSACCPNRTRREPCDNGRPGGHAVAMRWIGRGLKQFYVKAYTDNLTGLAGMVAYSLLLSIFPVALIALFVAGQVLSAPQLERSVLADLQELFPSATATTLTPGAARDPRLVDHRRHRRVHRQPLGRHVVLGRAGHRVLPHLRRAVPLLGAPEALRPRDARPRAAVLRRDGRACRRMQSLLLARRNDLPFGLSGRDALWALSLAAGLLINFVRARDDLPHRAERARRVARRVAGRARGDGGDLQHRLRLPVLPHERLDLRRPAHDARVHPDRAALVLRAGADHPRRRGGQRATPPAPPERYARGDAGPDHRGHAARAARARAQGARPRRGRRRTSRRPSSTSAAPSARAI